MDSTLHNWTGHFYNTQNNRLTMWKIICIGVLFLVLCFLLIKLYIYGIGLEKDGAETIPDLVLITLTFAVNIGLVVGLAYVYNVL